MGFLFVPVIVICTNLHGDLAEAGHSAHPIGRSTWPIALWNSAS